MSNHNEIPKNGPGPNEAPQKLHEEEVSRIVEKFNDERINTEEHPEFFSIHLKTRIVRIPKWKYIQYTNGTKVDIEEEIKQTLDQEPA